MSDYPYRKCPCGNQIHVGGVSLCDECIAKGGHVADLQETLRDRFAAADLMGFLANTNSQILDGKTCKSEGDYARISYCVADAMIQARVGK